MTRVLAFFAVLGTGALLLYASADFPDWGAHHSPANDSPVSLHYIEKTYSETSVPNMVTAVLADYRGYDTLFETVVIFTAGIAIMAILRNLGPGGLEGKPQGRWKSDPSNLVITTTCRLLVPVIQLFGLYVVAHGHYSPGGGFQGGVVLGASFILLAIGGDLREALSRFPERCIFTLAAVGV
ncbi:MAG: hydrogen gas-evolving membrane-bound hydrogenase subunit E, partial [Verrucomicrobiales bacterium]